MLYKRLVFMASIGKWVKELTVTIRINKMNERTVKGTENDKKMSIISLRSFQRTLKGINRNI